MARFLNPHKITLACLIFMYTELEVPFDQFVPVLDFIIDQLSKYGAPVAPPRPITTASDNPDPAPVAVPNLMADIDVFRTALDPHASYAPAHSLWRELVVKLWEIDSFDSLHDFFHEDLSTILPKTAEQQEREIEFGQDVEEGFEYASEGIRLSHASPFGSFLRRAQLEFLRLPFHDATALWTSFVAYRQPTASECSGGMPEVDVNLAEPGLDWSHPITTKAYSSVLDDEVQRVAAVTAADLYDTLEFQIEALQKRGARVSDDLKTQLELMLQSNVVFPSLIHYLTFLHSWRAGDYPSSLDSLHRFFDYNMIKHRRPYYQYALLNLAVLHSDFGCYGEAFAAIHETITIARELKDMACLNFCLSWTYHLARTHPEEMHADRASMIGSEAEGLAFLKLKAGEAGMWSLFGTSLLGEARVRLAAGGSLAEVFESIAKSSHVAVVKDVANHAGPQMLMQSQLWSRLGHLHLAWSYVDLYLTCHADDAPLEELFNATCRAAELLVQTGAYDEALRRLDQIGPQSRRVLNIYRPWLAFIATLNFRRELRHGNLDAAEHLWEQISIPEPKNREVYYDIHMLHVDLLTRRGAYSEALAELDRLSLLMRDEGADVRFRIRVFVLKALQLDKSGRPQAAFSVAVRAATLAWQAQLPPSLWHAFTAVCRVLMSLDELHAAKLILQRIIPQALESEDADLAAGLCSCLADVNMGLVGQAPLGTHESRTLLGHTVRMLETARLCYARLEDVRGQKEMMAKTTVVMAVADEEHYTESCATAYLQFSDAVGSVTSKTVSGQ